LTQAGARLWRLDGFAGSARRLLFHGANRTPGNVDNLFIHLHFLNSRQFEKQQKTAA